VRGIKILVDGIPQTLPDGQGQLTNLELGEVERIEVLRGSTSALFGNASGGVISVWTNPQDVAQVKEDARIVAGQFSQNTPQLEQMAIDHRSARRRRRRAVDAVAARLRRRARSQCCGSKGVQCATERAGRGMDVGRCGGGRE
jgi:outer membrane cobalamin receptor